VAAAGLSQPWRVVGAAVQGLSHEKLGLPCQDAQAYCVLPGEVLLVALADGAGSAGRAEEGARCAVEAALAALAAGLEDDLPEEDEDWEAALRSAFAQARQALLELADTAEEPPREYATTLTCAIAGSRLAVGQLGDGAVVARSSKGELQTVTRLQRGEYANETYFLTQEDALEQLQVYCVEGPVEALAVMSDGLIRLALRLPENEPHSPFFQPLFAFAGSATAEHSGGDQAVEQLMAFLDSERVRLRTDDDKALVLAVREVWSGAEAFDLRTDADRG
jgi:hypothetical protein